MNLVVDARIYVALWTMCLIGGVGIVRLARSLDVRKVPTHLSFGWVLTIGASLVYLVSLVRYSMTLGGVGHGRLIFPAIAGWSLLLAVGLLRVPPRKFGPVLLGASVGALAVLAAACPFIYIFPAYASPQPIVGDHSGASGDGLSFGDQLQLVSASMTPDVVTPGGSDPASVALDGSAATSARASR